MGEVYLARVSGAAGFQKPVVIKKILPHLVEEPTVVSALINEAKLMVMMDHPNIVQVLDLGEDGGTYFMAMEFVQGYNLSSFISHCVRHGVMIPAPICVHLASEILAGLEYIHGLRGPDGRVMNILHRDVSPQNVLISREGRVKLTDFGIAKVLQKAGGDFTQNLKGKLRYMAPEALDRARIDHRYDLYAAAVILYELICRAHLHSGRADATLMKKVREAVIPSMEPYHPGLPPELSQAIYRALSRDPDGRFLTAAEFKAALRRSVAREQLESAPADLRAMVDEIYNHPDFPAGKDKLPDLASSPPDQTISLVLTSTLEGTGVADDTLVTPAPPDMTAFPAQPRRMSLATILLSVGLLMTTGLTGALYYTVHYKKSTARSEEKPVIIVRPKASAMPPPIKVVPEMPAPAPKAAAPAPRRATPAPRKPPRAAAGRFSPERGARSFRRHNAALSRCFTRDAPRGGADISLQIISTITAAGTVSAVRLEPAAQAETPLGKCIIDVARRVRYEAHDRPQINFVQPLRVKRQGE